MFSKTKNNDLNYNSATRRKNNNKLNGNMESLCEAALAVVQRTIRQDKLA